MSLLSLHNFSVSFGRQQVVKNLRLEVNSHEIVALIGESGSGKSVTAQSITKLVKEADVSGSCIFNEIDMANCSADTLNNIRRREIAYIFQEPMTALNPLIKCGDQIAECLPDSKNTAERIEQLMHDVEMPEWKRMAESYPHELSGGQRQRIMIAMALAKEPTLIIADEPTTALDVAVQTEILQLLKKLSRENGLAVLFITHDILSLKNFADRIAVMYQGEIVETGTTQAILTSPNQPYTKALLLSRATYNKRGKVLAEVEDLLENPNKPLDKLQEKKESEEIVLSLEEIFKSHVSKQLFSKSVTKVLNGVSLEVNYGDTLGIIGESGSGKSTIAKIILSIWEASSGKIEFKGKPLSQIKNLEKEVQLVFQDPFSSLNPKHRIGEAITEVCKTIGKGKAETLTLLEEVGLLASDYTKYPHEFSGGQRQRICIAKALAKEPQMIVLDEAVSALDVSVQAKVLNLLNKLQQKRNLTYILISHDLNVVGYFCNKIVVLRQGEIVEQGHTEHLISNPSSDYTRELLEHSVH